VFATKGTPPQVVDKLYTEIKRALDEEVVQKKFRAAGVEPQLGMPSEVTKLLESQIMRWADVIRNGGIKID
jgi:tripartite-type tricarboxylate transporter receptor subunit TctC